jgi:hypothetical protein
VIGFGAKWYGKPVEWRSDHHDGHESMVRRAHELIDEADVLVTYNGDRFDIPWLKREFAEAGLTPPSPFQSVDLCKIAKKHFRFPSHKLQYVSTALGLEGKRGHEGHGLWVKCLAGDEKAWAQMRAYCKQDVVLTEKLYDVLKPWLPDHPASRILAEGDACPVCGSTDFECRGYYYTPTAAYQRLRCKACGKWFRSTKAEARTTVRGVA